MKKEAQLFDWFVAPLKALTQNSDRKGVRASGQIASIIMFPWSVAAILIILCLGVVSLPIILILDWWDTV